MTRFAVTTCYQCDAESTGREHVPPKCLFPKGGHWSNLMTVPSCSAHNNATSEADEYLLILLGVTASHVPKAIRDSVIRGAFRLWNKGSNRLHRYGFERQGEAMDIARPIPLEFDLLSACLIKMARALYFYHHCGQRKLLLDLEAWPLFIPVDPEVDAELSAAVSKMKARSDQEFEQHPKLGSHQEIFAYQIIEEPEFALVNMEIYGAHRAAVVRSTPRSADSF